jgi:hypothetical protein
MIKLRSLFGSTIKHISVDAENRLVDSRLDLIELDDVDERLNVGPVFLVCL